MTDERLDACASLIHNEQVKARASFYNSLAATVIVAGSVTPAGFLFFGNIPPRHHYWLWAAATLIFVACGIQAHRLALRTLKGLRS